MTVVTNAENWSLAERARKSRFSADESVERLKEELRLGARTKGPSLKTPRMVASFRGRKQQVAGIRTETVLATKSLGAHHHEQAGRETRQTCLCPATLLGKFPSKALCDGRHIDS